MNIYVSLFFEKKIVWRKSEIIVFAYYFAGSFLAKKPKIFLYGKLDVVKRDFYLASKAVSRYLITILYNYIVIYQPKTPLSLVFYYKLFI